MRLVMPADDSIKPLARRVGESRYGGPEMRRALKRADLPAAEAEAAEDFLLPPGEVWPDPAEASRHLERSHARSGRVSSQPLSTRSVVSSDICPS